MDSWNVDTSDPAAIRVALADTISQIDFTLAKARTNKIPISLMFATAIRERYDAVQLAFEDEDVRSMQWYADKVVANRTALYPDVFVAATGDAEVELARTRNSNIGSLTVVYVESSGI